MKTVALGAVAALMTASLTAFGASALTFVTGNDYAPYTDEKLPDGGMMTEVAREVAKKMGQDTTILFQPWKRGYAATLAGEADGTFPYVRSPEREAEMLYSEPMFVLRQSVFMPKSKTFAFDGLDSLKGKTVCSPIGYALPPPVEALVKAGAIKRQEPPDLQTCTKFLTLGRADFIIGDNSTVLTSARQAGTADAIQPASKPFDEISLHLVAAKAKAASPALIAAFNAGLAELKRSGAYAAIVRKHDKDAALD